MKIKHFLLSIAAGLFLVGGITSVLADWQTTQDVPRVEEIDMTPDGGEMAVAYEIINNKITTYYSSIDGAFYDHRLGGAKGNTSAKIVVIPTDTIFSQHNLTRNQTNFERLIDAKTLKKSVTIGKNKEIVISYDTNSTYENTSYGGQTNFGDSTAGRMASYMKNFITIGVLGTEEEPADPVTLTISDSSKLIVGAKLGNNNTGLVSAPTQDYAQITLEKNASIDIKGNISCYGYIKETEVAQGTTSVNLIGTSSSAVKLTVPASIYQAIGGSSSSSCASDHVFPYNIFSLVNIHSKITANYYSTIEMHFTFQTTSWGGLADTKGYMLSNSNAVFLMKSTSTTVSFYHQENLFLADGELKQGTEGGTGYQILPKVSKTLRDNIDRRTFINVDGDSEFGSITINPGLEINSANFYLPLNYEYQITIQSGTFTNTNRVVFLPGSTLTIKEDATVILNNHTLFLTKRKNENGKTLFGPTGAATYPYCHYTVTDPNDSEDKTKYYNAEDAKTELESETENAKLFNEGSLEINAGFGGKIYSTSNSKTATNLATITTGEDFLNIGNSLSPNSTTCPRFCGLVNIGDKHEIGFFQSQAYLKLFDGNSIEYNTLSKKSTYIAYFSNNVYGWVQKNAIVSYQTFGGTSISDKDIEISTESGYTVTSSDLPISNPTRDHYTFGGWYLDENCTIPFANTVTYKSITIYAKWNPIDYSIVYHCDKFSNGDAIEGSVTNPNAVSHPTYNVESAFALEEAIYGEYTFDGWYLNEDYTDKISTITSDVINRLSDPYTLHLYARWFPVGTETYTITYVNENEDMPGIASEEVISANKDSWAPQDLGGKNNDIDYPQYFEGWYLDPQFNTKVTSGDQITGNTTLYAHWINKNIITIKVLGTSVGAKGIKYLPANRTFTIPDISTYAPGFSLDERQGYDIMWCITGGDLDGNAYSTGDVVNLSQNGWGESIIVDYNYNPYSYSMSVTIGDVQTATLKVERNGSTVIERNYEAKATDTVPVKTGDVITLTNKTTDNDKTDGGGITTTNLTDNGNGTYTVNGEGAPSIKTADFEGGGCFTASTLITMADGSQKQIKDVSISDEIKVLDHETGMIINQKILAIFNHGTKFVNVIELKFDSGNNIEVCDSHCLFDVDLKDYVYIDSNSAFSYLHHRFLCCGKDGKLTESELINISIEERVEELWSIVGYKNHNAIANGMVSLTPFEFSFESYFEFDSEYKYNPVKKEEDIAKYGLYTYNEWSDYMNEWFFEGYNVAYIKILVGKGILKEEDIYQILARLASYIDNNEVVVNYGY